ncbi:MAG: hypothetical protein Q7S52_05420 [bacterium]|nr:hypothetical protein [bacterium]
MKKTVSQNDFVDAFDDYNRADNFSREGRRALYDYLESVEEDTGEQIELDVIAICEYLSAWDAMKEYQPEDMPVEGEEGDDLVEIGEKNEKAAREWLEEKTQVIDVEGGGVIILQF